MFYAEPGLLSVHLFMSFQSFLDDRRFSVEFFHFLLFLFDLFFGALHQYSKFVFTNSCYLQIFIYFVEKLSVFLSLPSCHLLNLCWRWRAKQKSKLSILITNTGCFIELNILFNNKNTYTQMAFVKFLTFYILIILINLILILEPF